MFSQSAESALVPGRSVGTARVAPEKGAPVKDALRIAELILSLSLIVLILMQSRGTSLGSVFGQEGSVFHTRRGAERILFNVSIAVVAAFLLIALALAHVAG